jgi:hypothetical protein
MNEANGKSVSSDAAEELGCPDLDLLRRGFAKEKLSARCARETFQRYSNARI